MLVTGVILGALTFISFLILFEKMPAALKRVILKYSFVSDVVMTIGSYFLLAGISSSACAAIGCAVAGVLDSVYLWIRKL
jgi:hypothetical protein